MSASAGARTAAHADAGPRALRRRRALVAAIVALALVARLALAVSEGTTPPVADAADFDRHAVSLAQTGHYPASTIAPAGGPTAFRPPAYPYLLAAAYELTGTAASPDRYVVARVLGALLGLVTVVLVGVVARAVWDDRTALVAMALAAIYPPLVTIGDTVLAEALFTPVVVAAVLAVLRQRRASAGLRWAALAGVLVGLAALTRTNGVILALPLAVGLVAGRASLRTALAPVVAMLAAAALTVTPWLVRDGAVFGRFVPLTTQTGFTLAGTYNEVSRTDPVHPAAWRPPLMAPYADVLARRDLDESAAEQRFRTLAFAFARQHPAYVTRVGAWNTARVFGLLGPGAERAAAQETGIPTALSDLDVLAFYLLALLALAGALTRRARRLPLFVWLVPVLLAASLVFATGYARYREPMDPVLILLAAAGLSGALAHLGRTGRHARIRGS